MYRIKYLFNILFIAVMMSGILDSTSLHAMQSQETKVTKKIEGSEITYIRPRSNGGRDVATYDPQTMPTHKACMIMPSKVSYYADPKAIYTWLAQQYEKQEQQKQNNH